MKVLLGILLIVILVISGCSGSDYTKEQLDGLASCLKEKGVKEYGAFWCPNCAKQQKMFGSSYDIINGLTGNAITNIQLPTLPVVILTALVDSINPCAIGVLILLIGTLLFLSKDKGKMLFTGLIYIIAVYVTYFLAGVGLLFFLQNIGASIVTLPLLGVIAVSSLIGVIVAIIVIIGGLIEIKDFFWYGKGFSLSISPKNAGRIKKYMKNLTIPGTILLGIFVAGVELPCTGGPYLAITTLLSKVGFDAKIG